MILFYIHCNFYLEFDLDSSDTFANLSIGRYECIFCVHTLNRHINKQNKLNIYPTTYFLITVS